jgi:hypothetical protein
MGFWSPTHDDDKTVVMDGAPEVIALVAKGKSNRRSFDSPLRGSLRMTT